MTTECTQRSFLFHSHRHGARDADLFPQKRDFLPQPLELRAEAEAGIEALGGPAEGGGQGEIGERDGVHGRRADAAGPAAGQRKRMGQRDTGHGRPDG